MGSSYEIIYWCAKCREGKLYYEFRSSDENKSRCTECRRKYGKRDKEHQAKYDAEYRLEHKEQKARYDTEYRLDNAEHIAKRMSKYRDENKESINASVRKRYKKVGGWGRTEEDATKKKAAGGAMNYAVRQGHLHKPSTCSKCQKSGRIEGHHNDYDKPYDVIWLCPKCHNAEHRPKTIQKG